MAGLAVRLDALGHFDRRGPFPALETGGPNAHVAIAFGGAAEPWGHERAAPGLNNRRSVTRADRRILGDAGALNDGVRGRHLFFSTCNRVLGKATGCHKAGHDPAQQMILDEADHFDFPKPIEANQLIHIESKTESLHWGRNQVSLTVSFRPLVGDEETERAARKLFNSAAALPPNPGTAAISSTLASRSRCTEPNFFSKAALRWSPMPGNSSSRLSEMRLMRSCAL